MKLQFNYKWAAVIVIGLGGLIGGAYTVGIKQGARNVADAPRAAGPLPQGAKLPGQGHPSVSQVAQQEPAEPQREGKVTVDPNAKFTHFRVGNRNVKDIFVDGKMVWVGTSGGVIRYDTGTDQFKMWDNKTGLLSNGMFHVGKLGGKIVVGTYGGGMSLLDAATGQWKNYNIPDGLGDAFVYDVLQTTGGDIWIATWSGVNRVRGGALDDRSKWDLYTVENTRGGLPNDWVYGLAEGKSDDVWLATEGGLARFRNGKWQNWNHAKGLGAPYEKVKDDIQFTNDPSKVSEHHARQKQEMGLQGINVAYNPNYIVSLAVDKDGVVWAGTWGGGLSRFDGTKWKVYTVKDGLPGNHVFMLHIDKKEQLWVGTNKGLARFGNGKFSALTTADGLFSDTVFAMDTADDGSLWIGSFGGVTHLRP